MRILWITTDFHPQVGGIETYTHQLINHLIRMGHQIGLVTNRDQEVPAESLLRDHFPIDALDRPTTVTAVGAVCRQLDEAIGSFRPQIVHFASAGLSAYASALPDDLVFVATVHGNDLTRPWQLWPGADLTEVIRNGLNRCAALFCVSRHTASLVASAGVLSSVHIIPNACDIEAFFPHHNSREAVLARYGISPVEAILLTVARLVPRKGHETVMTALLGIERPVHWIVVGEGRSFQSLWRQHIHTRLRSRITFAGRRSPSELIELYNVCDIFVLTPIEIRDGDTIDSEGFGLVFLEAGACGKPVIGSATSGCIDAINDGQTGLLVKPGDAADLAQAIKRLIDDPDLRLRLGAEAQRRIAGNGGWKSVAKRISDCYETVLAGRHGLSAADGRGKRTRARRLF